MREKTYPAEGVSEGGAGNTGADDDDFSVRDVHGTAFFIGEVPVGAFFLEILVLQLSFVGIATESVEKKEPEQGAKESPKYLLINRHHCRPRNETMIPR